MYTVENRGVPTLFRIVNEDGLCVAGCTANMDGHRYATNGEVTAASIMANLICKLLNDHESK